MINFYFSKINTIRNKFSDIINLFSSAQLFRYLRLLKLPTSSLSDIKLSASEDNV